MASKGIKCIVITEFCFKKKTAPKHNIPPIAPIRRAEKGVTNPQAGVIATRPETTPQAAPIAVGFDWKNHSESIQVNAEAAAAIFVLINAVKATSFKDNALPTLKPNQPNHNKPAPNIVNGK